MLLKQLVLDRFKSFKDRTVFDFSVSDWNKNIILIGWDNGSWKTSLLEALNIILYGVDSKKDIICNFNNQAARGNNWGCSMELEYTDDNWDIIRISRKWVVKWDYASKENIRESMVEEFFNAYRNGQKWDISENQWIEEIDAKMPKSVSEFFFFEWEKIKDMASDEVPDLLRESMEKIIWLEQINTLIMDLKGAKREILDESFDVRSEDMDTKNKLIQSKKAEYNVKDIKLHKASESLREVEKKLSEKNDEYSKLFWEWTDGARRIKDIDSKVGELNQELWVINKELDEFFNEGLVYLLLKPFYPDVESNIKKTEEYYDYIELHNRNQVIREKIIEWLYKPKDVVWHNDWEEKNRAVLEDKISEIFNEKKKEKSIIDLSNSDKELIRNIIRKTTTGEEMKNKQKRKDEILRELKNYDWEKQHLSVSEDKLEEQEKIRKELQDLKIEEYKYWKEKEKLTQELKRIRLEIDNHEKDYEKMGKEVIKSEKDRKAIEKIDSYLDALNEFKVELRKSKIWALQSNIELMFKNLYNKWNIKDIQIDADNFNILIYDSLWHRRYQYELSEWEKSLLAISLIWWLSRTSNLELPIITDAPLSVLDEWHRNNVLSNYFPKASSQVIILIKEIDLPANSEWFNLIKDNIWKSYTLNFDREKDLTTVENWYFKN